MTTHNSTQAGHSCAPAPTASIAASAPESASPWCELGPIPRGPRGGLWSQTLLRWGDTNTRRHDHCLAGASGQQIAL